MVKTNLPVLIIKDVVLLPASEIRLEFNKIEDKKLFSLAEAYYNNHILVVNPTDLLEEDPDISELPKIGVIGYIKLKMDMPNGRTRVIIEGINRTEVFNYNKEEELFEAVIGNVKSDELDTKEELAYIRSLIKQLEVYVNEVPYISNNVLTKVAGISNIAKVTDIVALYLPVDLKRKIAYINEVNPINRVKMLLDDINNELEIIKLEKKIETEVAHQIEESQKQFVLREKIRVIKEELGEVNDKDSELDKLTEKVKTLKAPLKIKKRLQQELNRYETTASSSPELAIIRNYIDWLLNLPWSNYSKDNNNLNKIKNILDNSHNGLDTVKIRILEYIAVKQKTANLKSPIICLVGPPGVGKTSLAKSIAASLNRKWAKISVGGINDEAEIVGHRRSYIGASPGKIIQGMKKVGIINPVFIIDEIDKMTKDIKGDPASSLLEVLDPEQNKYFVDHYIEEEFDLSKVMFITTANYINQIAPELRDRLEVIELSSYTEIEKKDIAQKHSIKKIIKEHGLSNNQVVFTDNAIMSIIRNYTKEAGVRELERLIASIIRKIVKEIIESKNNNKYKIDEKDIIKYLGQYKYNHFNNEVNNYIGIVNAMAYTPFGGEIFPIETIKYNGKGNINLTGSLGDVIKESINIALSYIKNNSDLFNIDIEFFAQDLHIHMPEGATPKDGPSAGIAITTALISLFTKKPVKTNISMTGEITLQGRVLQIGGLKEKLIAAHRSGIKKVYVPKANEKDLEEIDNFIKKTLKIKLVSNYIEIYNDLFKDK